MHLNILDAVYRHHMIPHFLCDFIGTDRGNRKLHRKQVVSVVTECLTVKEVSPPSHNLTEHDAHARGIHQKAEVLFLLSAVNHHRNAGTDDAAVDGKSALADVENTQKIILIIVPGKYNVVNPCPENTGCDADHRKIEVLLRVLPRPLCLSLGNPDRNHHTGYDHDAVIGNGKSENTDVFSHMIEINPEIGKINFHIHNLYSLLLLLIKR